MSFESLVKKLMKEGKSKTAATKIAGSVANAKMKGAGSGPTAKQKARAKSPATKKRKPTAVIRDKNRVADKSRSYTDKKGKKVEIKTFKHEKAYDSGVKDDPNKPYQKRKSSRLSNTVELHKTKTKKDGTTKTKVKRAAGGTKKSQRLHTKFAKGKNKEGSSDVIVENRKSPTTMKKQGYNARLDDSLGAKNGKKKQSMKSRRDESEGMEKKMKNKKFSGNKSSAQGKAPAKMKSPAKKPLVGGQKKLPKELQEAILKAPAKMLSKSGIKMMDKSPAKMKAPMKKQKSKSTDAHGNVTKTTVKGNKKKEVTRVKREYASNAKPLAENPTVKRKGKKRYVKKTTYASNAQPLAENPSKVKTKGTAPIKKSKQKVEQDYARNAIADYKSGKKKEAKYEKKKALEMAAGESPAKMKNPSKKRAKLMDKVEKFDNLSNFRGRPGNLKPRKKDVSAKRYDKRIDKGFKKADKKMSKVMAIDSAAKMKKSPSMMKGGEKREVKKMAVKLGSSARPGKRTGNTEFKPMKMVPYEKKHEMATFKRMKPMKEASPTKMKSNQDGGGYAAKNMAAPARQLKKLGSVLSKHFKSNR